MVYLPPAFTETRVEVLIEHIGRHDFGLLVTGGPQGYVSEPNTVLAEQRDGALYLHGHLARPNPQAAELTSGEALAIFTGPHAYISPSWYAAHPSVPTWNYADVHAYGAARIVEDEGWLLRLLHRLSARHETGNPQPWLMQDLPPAYLAGMLKGIVGFEIAVTRLEGKFKLSQNRPASDRPRVIAALDARGDPDSAGVARLMREREPAE